MSTIAKCPGRLEQTVLALAPLVEVLVAYVLIESALWSGTHAHRYVWAWLATAWIIAATIYRRPSLSALGLNGRAFAPALWLTAAGLAFVAAVLLAGFLAGTLHDYSRNGDLPSRGAGYLIWSFEQEFILQSFMFRRIESFLHSGKKAVLVCALLFSIAHLPSPLLTVGTFIMGGVFCEFFRRYRNIYPLAITHWMIGMSLSVVLPDSIAHHMRVGIGYLHFVVH